MSKPFNPFLLRRETRLRPNATSARHNLIVDQITFMCPVRHRFCVALEDRRGNFWSGPSWVPGGEIMMQAEKLRYCEIPFSMPTIYAAVEEDVIQTLWDEDVSLLACAKYGHEYIELDATIIENDEAYLQVRERWNNYFEEFHPAPPNSKKKAHEVSMAIARTKHSNVCHRAEKRAIRRAEDTYRQKEHIDDRG